MPHTFETVVDGGIKSHRMYIDKVKVNQPMEDTLFVKPELAMANTSGG
jgi:hypothetical protein